MGTRGDQYPEVLVMYRKRESAKEYEEREMLRRAFDTST
jgi:hypothetical protein